MSANTFNPMLRSLARKVLPVRIREVLRRWISNDVPASYGYQIIEGDVPAELLKGWKGLAVAQRQYAAFAPLLREMYGGKPREDFVALANAVRMTDLQDPLIIEVGCGSGWNGEVLRYLLERPVRYIGLDYSHAMVALGRWYYPQVRFIVGDATCLPLRDAACDVLVSGTVLMHLLGYEKAIQESRRVARAWCILHTVPVVQKRPTTLLKKFAYSIPVVEVIFQEEELLQLISDNGFVVVKSIKSMLYDLQDVLGEPISTRTYVCKIE